MNNTRVIVTKFGGPDVLEIIEEAMPQPSEGEVRIKVIAAGIALADGMRREGVYPGTPTPPFTPGYDYVGVIEAVGQGVSRAWIGQRVTALMNGIGGYTRYICSSTTELVILPQDADPYEALSLVLNYVTAYQMLRRLARIEWNDSILIHGAAGGVGSALLDLGKLYKLSMFGTASASKHGHLIKYGAVPIDYKNEDFVARIRCLCPDGIRAVFDPIGGENWKRSYQVLNANGTFVGYGFTTILSTDAKEADQSTPLKDWQQLAINKKTPLGHTAHLYSITSLKETKPEWYREDLTQLLDLLVQGQIKPVVAKRFSLQDVRSAHEFLMQSSGVGKIILDCNDQ
jgi:NADPH:quinone reductase-like Zn-dependent oxidoreductase